MAKSGHPKKNLQLRPGESPWSAMARELAHNPDSPASLKIMSAVSQAMAPRQRAIDQVVEALEAQLQHAGAQQDAAVIAAIQYWEREFQESMAPAMLTDLQQQARERVERRRRQPPSMESIMASSPASTDTGYDLGVHLHGLKGTWHRLWGMIAMVHSFGNDVATDDGVVQVRQQFQELLGRDMSKQEWDALAAHAVTHAETVMIPSLGSLDHPDKP